VKFPLQAVSMKSQEAPTTQGNKTKVFPSSSHLIRNDSSPATLGIMALVVIILESYQKVHQVIQLDFSLVLHLLKITGQSKWLWPLPKPLISFLSYFFILVVYLFIFATLLIYGGTILEFFFRFWWENNMALITNFMSWDVICNMLSKHPFHLTKYFPSKS